MNSIVKKVENWVAVILVTLLTLYPFAILFCQKVLGIQIPDADRTVFQFVFLFSCVAGIITWREDEHLKLSSFARKFPKKVAVAFENGRTFLTAVILTAFFFTAFCTLANPSTFTEVLWGIPLKVFYFFLPVCYLSFVIMVACGKEYKIAAISGIVIGVLISMGPVTGTIYYWFNVADDKLPLLYKISDGWNSFANIGAIPLSIIFVFSAFFGVPLFVVLGAVSYILFSAQGGYVDVIPLEIQRIFTDKNVAAIPLFTIGGYVLAQSSAGRRYVDVFKSLFGWFRGGTVVAAVIVTTFFSTFTGVSGVTILALGALLSAVLTGTGYDKERAESLVTASGAIGLLFPPSAAIIMFSTSNYFYVDVFDMFKAAIIPGIFMALAMIATGFVFDKQKIRPKFNIKEVGRAVKNCIPELLLPVFICAFFFKGVFDIFEVSAFTVLYAVIVTTFIRKDFFIGKNASSSGSGAGNEIFTKDEPAASVSSASENASEISSERRSLFNIIASSIPISGGVLFILASASGIAYYIMDAAVPQILSNFMISHISHPWVFLLLMNLVLLVIGCLMDMFSAILIVSPLFLETALAYNLNPVSIGVVFLLNLSIGFITPPVGMDLFISKYAFDKPLGKVIRGIIPFLLVQLVVLTLVTYVPWFTTALLGK